MVDPSSTHRHEPQHVGPTPCTLYRFYDLTGDLLYVGVSLDLPTRLTDHRHGKPWWAEATQVTLDHHPDRACALHAEKIAILNEHPRYNIQHNGANSSHSGTNPHISTTGERQWTFASLRSGYQRTEPLWLYWEANCDPCSDDYGIDEISAPKLWRRWLTRYPRDETAEAIFGPGAVSIAWFVEGPGIFEYAPFQDLRADREYWRIAAAAVGVDAGRRDDRQFLTSFTWPVDPETHKRLQWSRLPVIDKVWRQRNLPSRYATKGGFIQEATGFKPAPMQPYLNTLALADMCGLYHPSRAR